MFVPDNCPADKFEKGGKCIGKYIYIWYNHIGMIIGATDTTTADSKTQGSFADGCSMCLSRSIVACNIYCYVSSVGVLQNCYIIN